jgi:hypothetical protein
LFIINNFALNKDIKLENVSRKVLLIDFFEILNFLFTIKSKLNLTEIDQKEKKEKKNLFCYSFCYSYYYKMIIFPQF